MNAVRSEDGAETARLKLPRSRRRPSRSKDRACQGTEEGTEETPKSTYVTEDAKEKIEHGSV